MTHISLISLLPPHFSSLYDPLQATNITTIKTIKSTIKTTDEVDWTTYRRLSFSLSHSLLFSLLLSSYPPLFLILFPHTFRLPSSLSSFLVSHLQLLCVLQTSFPHAIITTIKTTNQSSFWSAFKTTI